MILFISDLHLQASETATTRAFLDFLAGPAREAKELWILGDLFEFWVGDDDLADPFHARIAQALAALSQSGVRVSIVVGNRDFLLGQRFAARSGARIVAEPALVQAPDGRRLLLLHGDAQCTDDLAYQRFRRRIRSPLSLLLLRCLPLSLRRALARRIRRSSESARQYANKPFIDLNPQVTAQLLRETGADAMIHGHTHRPACHALTIDGRVCQRWVLADWHGKASWLEAGPDGLKARSD